MTFAHSLGRKLFFIQRELFDARDDAMGITTVSSSESLPPPGLVEHLADVPFFPTLAAGIKDKRRPSLDGKRLSLGDAQVGVVAQPLLNLASH
mmetsp:Transcript_15720/g.37340  ORF Transcript_15720/g.37340 Transcript_15720/m.37340 type:complete len:93 (+) Transcript_15720:89-367(+)